jgi:hypothetical protein
MYSIQWLLQENHPNLSAMGDIGAILRELSFDVHMVNLKGRSTEIPDLHMLDQARPVVCYGPSFVPRAFGHSRLTPGIWFDPETFRWSAFSESWGDLMLSADAEVIPADEAVLMLGNHRMFVRPDEDSKAFDGGLYGRASLETALAPAFEKKLLAADTPIVVAKPIDDDAEWRTFVVGGDVVAASSYRKEGQGNIDLHVPHKVVDLAYEAAAIWAPAEVFCLDIAQSGSRYGIVEANCFNASRFYGADASAILEAVSSFADRTFVTGAIERTLPAETRAHFDGLLEKAAAGGTTNVTDMSDDEIWNRVARP